MEDDIKSILFHIFSWAKKKFLSNKMKILHLTLHKRWFDEIKYRNKKEEYRDIKPYWLTRLFDKEGKPKGFDIIEFRNGYNKNSRKMIVKFLGLKKDKSKITIKLGKIIK